ncbi:DUF680 domain-containing protein [Mesorhizobium sp. BR1-1-3]|uniref:DUF680 domain-containing protein n=1 Tax=unclassified Mesorhizobium TaxID=325217 RepID=UPI000FCC53BE|nr:MULTISPECIES: DUF680 domain-containing protein [unclassified Mesorhizobium]MBZ9887489.1 DUF680 domain-containing protein [Mesorhizobium sp. BR1-1-3]RUY21257.1 DUF680 domain-containing protein [Mesorhizobium sp. M7A.F.Ca.US.001.04.2.1]RUY33970.1 DUF680 domain-containing protein [Mesorhizobium sp. M7A.F.Ca.US.001.04.1.1]
MKKIVLTAAAILVASGTAFAGSDHYGSNTSRQPVASHSASKIDTSHTSSIREVKKIHGGADASVPAQYGQGTWGN